MHRPEYPLASEAESAPGQTMRITRTRLRLMRRMAVREEVAQTQARLHQMHRDAIPSMPGAQSLTERMHRHNERRFPS